LLIVSLLSVAIERVLYQRDEPNTLSPRCV
jgi:hypothetical protein